MAGRHTPPVTQAEGERREQARADKLTALHEHLAEQVGALRSGQDWRRWLDVARLLPAYSFNNVLLIAAQRPDATAVAGYQAWRALGRQVDKGQRGIQILAPIVRRPRAGEDPADPADRAEPGETGSDPGAPATAGTGPGAGRDRRSGRGQLSGFRVTHVWDISQTSGEPLPTPPLPRLLSGQGPPGLWAALTRLVAERGFTVERGDCGAANGRTDFTARTVRVRADVDDAQAVRTLAHETGHVLLHDPHQADGTVPPAGGSDTSTAHCRGSKEVEAESVAYLVTASHGLTGDDYTFPYVTGWAASIAGTDPEKAVRDVGERVLTAARVVLAGTQPDPSPTLDPALAVRASAGAERTAAAREHAEVAHALTRPPAGPSRADGELADLARLQADAAAFYTAQLTGPTAGAGRANAVLARRAVPAEAVAVYELGYAPAGWTALADHLRARGYTDAQLLAAGVGIATRRGTVVDRFRDRLMFPIRDPAGQRVVGFLGRALTDPAPSGVPKYLNSPDTALYSKGQLLYGLSTSPDRPAPAAGARPVLVEGPLDAIAVTSAGAGRYLGVSPCGTALRTRDRII